MFGGNYQWDKASTFCHFFQKHKKWLKILRKSRICIFSTRTEWRELLCFKYLNGYTEIKNHLPVPYYHINSVLDYFRIYLYTCAKIFGKVSCTQASMFKRACCPHWKVLNRSVSFTKARIKRAYPPRLSARRAPSYPGTYAPRTKNGCLWTPKF